MTPLLSLTVPGIPRPQGSLKILVNPHTGQPFAKNSDATAMYRNQVVAAWQSLHGDAPPLTCAVAVRCRFQFPRPKGHYGTGRNADRLRPSAPRWHSQTPDTDKLLRLQGDALTIAGVIRDDCLLVVMRGEKAWGAVGLATVELWPLEAT